VASLVFDLDAVGIEQAPGLAQLDGLAGEIDIADLKTYLHKRGGAVRR